MRMCVYAGACLALAALVSPAGAAAGKLAALDVFNLELAGAPQISPDGKRVVYVRQFSDVMADKRHSNLWIVHFDGSGHRPLTSGNFSDAEPQWSSDGTQLVFVSDRGGSPQIHRLWVDTGQIARITNLTQAPGGVRLSPDGKWISFVMSVPAKPGKIVDLPAAPEGAKWAEPARIIDRTIYRFNGMGYLKPGYKHVFVVPLEGGTPRQVSSGDFQHGGPMAASDAVWSADSKPLLISVNRQARADKDPLNTEIYEYGLENGTVKALTSRKGPDMSPEVSPDGRLVAYTGFEDRYLGNQTARLSIMNPMAPAAVC